MTVAGPEGKEALFSVTGSPLEAIIRLAAESAGVEFEDRPTKRSVS